MLVKFEQNRVVTNTRNFELYDKNKNKNKQTNKNKNGFLKPFWQSVDAMLGEVSEAKAIV